MSQFDTAQRYDFLLTFHRNYASVLCRFEDIGTYLSKVAIFSTLLVFGASILGVPH